MKGLEALLKLYIQVEPTKENIELTDTIERELKAFEVVDNKNVDVLELKNTSFKEYNKLRIDDRLPHKDWRLLREVMKK